MNNQIGIKAGQAQASTAPIASDVFDRIIQILNSAIDMEQRIGHRIAMAADRLLGPIPQEATPKQADAPTIASLLGDLERAQSFTSSQLDRFLEARI